MHTVNLLVSVILLTRRIFLFFVRRGIRCVFDRCESDNGLCDVQRRRREEFHSIPRRRNRYLLRQMETPHPWTPQGIRSNRFGRRRRCSNHHNHHLLQVCKKSRIMNRD